jgi:Co/Zn/Cd efflux system component
MLFKNSYAMAAFHAVGAGAMLAFALSTSAAAPICGGIAAALSSAEAIASHPANLSRRWPWTAVPSSFPFGAARLPALVRFSTAVVAAGSALLVVLERIVHAVFGQAKHHSSPASPSSTIGIACIALLSGLGADWTGGSHSSASNAHAPLRPVAVAALLLVGGLVSDALATSGLVLLLVNRATEILVRDGRLLMQATRDASETMRYEQVLQRAARVPGVCAVYDGCFWDLDGDGNGVGAVRIMLAHGGAASAMSTLRQVRALFAETPAARDLTVHLEIE